MKKKKKPTEKWTVYRSIWHNRRTDKIGVSVWKGGDPKGGAYSGQWCGDCFAIMIVHSKTGKVVQSYGDTFKLQVLWAKHRAKNSA